MKYKISMFNCASFSHSLKFTSEMFTSDGSYIITLFISWKHLSNIVITFIDYYVEKNYRSQMLMIEVLLGKPVIYKYM